MKVMMLFVLVAMVGTMNSVLGSQQMMMGGTVKDFLDELLQGEEISQQHYNFLLREAETVIFEGHHARDNIFRPVSDTSISSYISGEVADERITQDTANYLSNLLNLKQPEENTFESPRLPSTNALAIKAAPAYTGNGNVVRLGKIKPETINANELYNGIWGYAVGGREYALQCNSRGLHIIDVTNTNNIYQVQKIAMSGGRIWRDVEVYENYAYVAAQSGGNFFVVNLSKLSGDPGNGNGPNSNPIPPSDYVDRGRTDWGHTLSIGNGLLFLNEARGQNGCQIFDLTQNPFDPPLISSWSGSGNDCHDSFARANINDRDLLFSADGYSGRFRLIDIQDIRKGVNPQKIGETPTIGTVYAHSIYPSEDNNFLYAFDEQNNFDIIVWDISDPSTPSFVSTIKWSGETTEGDAIIHNGQVRGNYLLTAYYEAGFRVFDISNPANAVEVGKYETYRDPEGQGVYQRTISTEYEGAWNLYSFLPSGNVLVSDQSSGTFIFRVEEVEVPTAPADLTVTLLDGGARARLEWQSSSTSEGKPTGYTLKRSITRGGPYTNIKTNIIETEYTDGSIDASNSVGYYYVLTATNARGESSLSNEVSTAPSSPEPTDSPTPIPTASSTPEPTDSPTPIPTASSTPEPTNSPTPIPTTSSPPEPTDSPTPIPTASSPPEPTDSPTPAPTASSPPEPTDSPTPIPTASSTPEPTDSPTPIPTASSPPEPTDSPTPIPTASSPPEPTDSPTPAPTASSPPEPTDSPTPIPTASSTPEPTDSPTPIPTASSTPEPTDSPTLIPTTSPNGPDLILSEILPNPQEVLDKHGEFIEIFNPASTNVLLDETRYRLCRTRSKRCKRMTGEVPANGYYVFCRNSAKFPMAGICNKSRLFSISNRGDTIKLQKNIDGSWVTVDRVTYPNARRKGDQGFARSQSEEPFCECWDWSGGGYSAGYGP